MPATPAAVAAGSGARRCVSLHTVALSSLGRGTSAGSAAGTVRRRFHSASGSCNGGLANNHSNNSVKYNFKSPGSGSSRFLSLPVVAPAMSRRGPVPFSAVRAFSSSPSSPSGTGSGDGAGGPGWTPWWWQNDAPAALNVRGNNPLGLIQVAATGKGGRGGSGGSGKGTAENGKGAVSVVGADVDADADTDGDDEDLPSASVSDALVAAGEKMRDSALPDLNNLICMALERRPLFPGMVFQFTVADPLVVEAIKQVERTGNPFVTTFLTDPKKVAAADMLSKGKKKGSTNSNSSGSNSSEAKHAAEVTALVTRMRNVQDESSSSRSEAGQVDPSLLHEVGTLAEITEIHGRSMMMMMGDHSVLRVGDQGDSFGARLKQQPVMTVVLKAKERVRMERVNSVGPPVMVQVEKMNDEVAVDEVMQIDALSRLIKDSMGKLLRRSSGTWSSHFLSKAQRLDGAALCDFAAGFLSSEPEVLQRIFEERNVRERMEETLVQLRKEENVSKLEMELDERLQARFLGKNRQTLLMEKMRMIQEELGGGPHKGGGFGGAGGGGGVGGAAGSGGNGEPLSPVAIIENRVNAYNQVGSESGEGDVDDPEEVFLKKIRDSNAVMPVRVKRAVDTELARFRNLDPVGNSSEYNVSRLYLDWLTSVPWDQYSQDNLDIKHALDVLDREHYGMKDVKERILEFISVAALTGNPQGKILCFVGPPGTGKTSIGQSIAHALNRTFHRISVGGQYDVSEIKGHRRTYVASMPGKITHCLKHAGVMNPVIMIDEIDKIGHGPQGDMRAALLEVLDTSQNHSFADVYLDVPLDLSQVLFICTANELYEIPGPLRDRMEVINLAGYDTSEKVRIAREYLIPKAKKTCGFVGAEEPKSEASEADDAAGADGAEGVAGADGVGDGGLGGGSGGGGRRTVRVPTNNVSMSGVDTAPPAAVVVGGRGFVEAPVMAATSRSTSRSASAQIAYEHPQPVLQMSSTSELEASSSSPAKDTGSGAISRKPVTQITMSKAFADNVDISDEAVEYLARNYSREPGMRNFNNYIERIFRKLAHKYVELQQSGELEAKQGVFQVKVEDLKDLVGPPMKDAECVFETPSPGLVFGLAAGPAGGTVLAIETTSIRRAKDAAKSAAGVKKSKKSKTGGKEDDGGSTAESGDAGKNSGGLFTTGLLRESMKESTEIAYINARHLLQDVDPGNAFFEENQVHLHVPTAHPKDGPSAGITMTTALISLALGRPIPLTTSMTGEISLGGFVMAVGGIKDKVLAARRQGIDTLILPRSNQDTFEELPPHLKDGLQVHFVDRYEEVFDVVFGKAGASASAASKSPAASSVAATAAPSAA